MSGRSHGRSSGSGRSKSRSSTASPDPRIAEYEAKVRPSELFTKRCQASNGTSPEALFQDCGVSSDPVKHWQDYVQYNRTHNFPESEFQLLKSCVRSCIFMPQYKKDLEFVKFFIFFTKTCHIHHQDPLQEFQLALNCHFGREMAVFWISWTAFAEKAGNYALTLKLFEESLECVQGDEITIVNDKFASFKVRIKDFGIDLSSLRDDDCCRVKRSRSRSRSKQPTKKQNSNIDNKKIYALDSIYIHNTNTTFEIEQARNHRSIHAKGSNFNLLQETTSDQDLGILEQQQRDALQQLASIKVVKQDKLDRVFTLESKLQNLKISNKELHNRKNHAHTVISNIQSKVATAEISSKHNNNNLKKFDEKLKHTRDIVNKLHNKRRNLDGVMIRLENKSDRIQQREKSVGQYVKNIKEQVQSVANEEMLLTKDIHDLRNEKLQCVSALAQMRSDSVALDKELTNMQQLEVKTKIALEQKKSDLQLELEQFDVVKQKFKERFDCVDVDTKNLDLTLFDNEKEESVHNYALNLAFEKCVVIQKEENIDVSTNMNDAWLDLDSALVRLDDEKAEIGLYEMEVDNVKKDCSVLQLELEKFLKLNQMMEQQKEDLKLHLQSRREVEMSKGEERKQEFAKIEKVKTVLSTHQQQLKDLEETGASMNIEQEKKRLDSSFADKKAELAEITATMDSMCDEITNWNEEYKVNLLENKPNLESLAKSEQVQRDLIAEINAKKQTILANYPSLSSINLSFDPQQSWKAQIEESLYELRELCQSKIDNAKAAFETRCQKVTLDNGDSESSGESSIHFDIDLDYMESGGIAKNKSWKQKVTFPPDAELGVRVGRFQKATAMKNQIRHARVLLRKIYQERMEEEDDSEDDDDRSINESITSYIDTLFEQGLTVKTILERFKETFQIEIDSQIKKYIKDRLKKHLSMQDYDDSDEDSDANTTTNAQLKDDLAYDTSDSEDSVKLEDVSLEDCDEVFSDDEEDNDLSDNYPDWDPLPVEKEEEFDACCDSSLSSFIDTLNIPHYKDGTITSYLKQGQKECWNTVTKVFEEGLKLHPRYKQIYENLLKT